MLDCLDSTTEKNAMAPFSTKRSETTAAPLAPKAEEQVTTDAGRSSLGNLKRPWEELGSDICPRGLGHESRSES
jgi:hypothetical protein